MIGNLVENESSRIVLRYRHLALSLETAGKTSAVVVLSVHPLAHRFSDEVFLFAPMIMIQLKLESKLHCKYKDLKTSGKHTEVTILASCLYFTCMIGSR